MTFLSNCPVCEGRGPICPLCNGRGRVDEATYRIGLRAIGRTPVVTPEMGRRIWEALHR